MRYVMILYGINKPNVNLIGLSLFSFFGGEAAKKGEKEIFGPAAPEPPAERKCYLNTMEEIDAALTAMVYLQYKRNVAWALSAACVDSAPRAISSDGLIPPVRLQLTRLWAADSFTWALAAERSYRHFNPCMRSARACAGDYSLFASNTIS